MHNRPGNIHDGKASTEFLKALFEQLKATLDRRHVLEIRMDGAFFLKDVVNLLEAEHAEYAIKVPFFQWLGLKKRIVRRRRWQRVDDRVEYFEQRIQVPAWSRTLRVVIYRKQVMHRTVKNHQLDLFDPDDGYYEYSATVTNKTVSGRTLWFFLRGRGTHEKVYGELKGGFAFSCVPTQRYEANSARQVMSVIAFNLMRALQTGKTERWKSNRKRQTIHRFQSIHSLRYQFINQAGLLIQPNGRQTLDVGNNKVGCVQFQAIEKALAA